MPPEGGELSEEEVALVLRRATELDRPAPSLPGVVDAAALEEAAAEVGVPRSAVRQALAELRSGALTTAPPSPAARLLGPPLVVVHRSLQARPAVVTSRLRDFLRGEHFEVRRTLGARTTWVPRASLGARVARSVDRSVRRRLVLREVQHVELGVFDDDRCGGSQVTLAIDVRHLRQSQAVLVGGGVAAGGALAVVALALGGLDPLALLATAGGGGVATGGHAAGRALYRSGTSDLLARVEGVLDRIDGGGLDGGSIDGGGPRGDRRRGGRS